MTRLKRDRQTEPSSTPREETRRMPEPERERIDDTPYRELLTAALRVNELVERMHDSSHKQQNDLAATLNALIHKFSGK